MRVRLSAGGPPESARSSDDSVSLTMTSTALVISARSASTSAASGAAAAGVGKARKIHWMSATLSFCAWIVRTSSTKAIASTGVAPAPMATWPEYARRTR